MFSFEVNLLHILLVVVDGSEDYLKMLEEAQQWLSIAKSFISLSNLCPEQFKIQIVVHRDNKEKSGEEEQLMKLSEELRSAYSAQFSVSKEIIILNCFKPHSDDLKGLLDTLRRFEESRCRKVIHLRCSLLVLIALLLDLLPSSCSRE